MQNFVSVFMYNKVILIIETIDHNNILFIFSINYEKRYTEKSPGRIVGNSQCEKLPVEV